MGQHKTNLVAQAAKRGEISKADRQPRVKTPTHKRQVVGGKEYHERNTIKRKGRAGGRNGSVPRAGRAEVAREGQREGGKASAAGGSAVGEGRVSLAGVGDHD